MHNRARAVTPRDTFATIPPVFAQLLSDCNARPIPISIAMDGEHGADRSDLVQEGHEKRLCRQSPESIHDRGQSKAFHTSIPTS